MKIDFNEDEIKEILKAVEHRLDVVNFSIEKWRGKEDIDAKKILIEVFEKLIEAQKNIRMFKL